MATNYFDVQDLTVGELFEKRRPFHIPSFQRPYSWAEDAVEKLWADIEEFFLKQEPHKHRSDPIPPRYFLGSIVSYKSPVAEGVDRNAVIDGQQRITTLMILLKSFYDDLNAHTKRDDPAQKKDAEILVRLEKTLWLSAWNDVAQDDVFDIKKPILTSEAIEDLDAVGAFKTIMTSVNVGALGLAHSKKNSRYIENYILLTESMGKSFATGGALAKFSNYKWQLIQAVLDNCILLHIDCKEERSALRIFNTLNNRGMQLRDADILKSYLYETYGTNTDEFKRQWSSFSVLSKMAAPLKPDKTPAQDEMFRFLMMWSKASKGNSDSDMALREYFENGNGGAAELTSTVLRDKLIPLAGLFAAIAQEVKDIAAGKPSDEDEDGSDSMADDSEEGGELGAFDQKMVEDAISAAKGLLTQTTFKYMEVLASFNKNAYWRHLLAVYYFKHRDETDASEKIELFIKKVAAFNLCYLIYPIPFTQIRVKTYKLLCDIFKHGDFDVADILKWSNTEPPIALDEKNFAQRLEVAKFKAPFSRALTLLHAYLNPSQTARIPLSAQVEHIFPKSWDKSMTAAQRVAGIYGIADADMETKIYENFGNKVMLEPRQNILASDGYFDLKACVYQGNFYGKKYAVNRLPDGTRTQDDPGHTKKAEPTAIADVQEIWKLPEWGKAQIIERDNKVMGELLAFFRGQLIQAS